MRARGALTVVTLVAGLACTGRDATRAEPLTWVARPGLLSRYGDSMPLVVPPRATVGESIAVRVHTETGGCMRQGRVRVERAAMRVDLFPEDEELVSTGQEIACPAVLGWAVHGARVAFARPGRAVVRAHGRSGAAAADRPLSVVERVVEVVPAVDGDRRAP